MHPTDLTFVKITQKEFAEQSQEIKYEQETRGKRKTKR